MCQGVKGWNTWNVARPVRAGEAQVSHWQVAVGGTRQGVSGTKGKRGRPRAGPGVALPRVRRPGLQI